MKEEHERCPKCHSGDIYRYALATQPLTYMARCICGWEDDSSLLVGDLERPKDEG
jgi:uncharacterized protein (DUF983 family)